MKKKIFFRVSVNIVLILCAILSVVAACMTLHDARAQFMLCEIKGMRGETYGWAIHNTVAGIAEILCALIAVVFFVFFNFKDISYLCGSLFKEMKEHKEATKEERKQKKIEELEKELNELKKDK